MLKRPFRRVISSETLGHASWSLAERGVAYGFNFLGLLILVRLISVAEYGRWMFFLACVSLLELYKASAVNSAVLFHASRHPENRARIEAWACKSSLRALTVIGAVCLVAALGYEAAGRREQAIFFLCYPLWSAGLIPSALATATLQASGQFRRAALLRLGMSFCSLLATAALLLVPQGWRICLLPVAMSAGALLSAAVAHNFRALPAGPDIFLPEPSSFDFEGSLDSYSRRTYGTALCSCLYRSADILMIGLLRDPISLALYTIALKMGDLLDLPLQAAAPVVMAHVSRRSAKGGSNWVTAAFLRSCFVLVGICLPVCLMFLFLPGWILGLAAGEKYRQAAPVLAVYGIVALVRPVDRMAGVFLDALARPGDNLKKTMVLTTVNMGLNGVVLSFVPGQTALPCVAAVSAVALVTSAGFGIHRLHCAGWLKRPWRRSLPIASASLFLLTGCATISSEPVALVAANPTESQQLIRAHPPCEPQPSAFPSQGSTTAIPQNWAEWIMNADERDLVLLALVNHPSVAEAGANTSRNEARLEIEKKSWLAPFGFDVGAGHVLGGGGRGVATGTFIQALATFKANLERELTYEERVAQFEQERNVAAFHEDVVRGELAWNVRRRLESLRSAVRLLRVRSESLEATNLQAFYADRDFRVGVIPVYEWSRVTEIANKAREAYLTSVGEVRVFKTDLEEALGMTVEEAYRLRFGRTPKPLKLESLTRAAAGDEGLEGAAKAPAGKGKTFEKVPEGEKR